MGRKSLTIQRKLNHSAKEPSDDHNKNGKSKDSDQPEHVYIHVKKGHHARLDPGKECESANAFWCRCKEIFHHVAARTATAMGSPISFLTALSIVLLWALSGPLFGFTDTWQLVINTGTTIVTFLMVFLIQNSQNRDSRAIHLKLDELLRAIGPARNRIINLEECSDEEIEKLELEFKQLRTVQSK